MPNLKLSDSELNNIITDYNNGMSMDQITKKYHHDKNTLKKYFKKHNIDIVLRNRQEAILCSQKRQKANEEKRKYFVKDDYFSEQNANMAYIMGFIMADGSISKKDNRIQICLSENDADFLKIFYNEIGGSQIVYYKVKDKYPTCRWQCCSSQIKKDLISYEIIPHKTGFAKIPNNLEKQFYPDFIRGYFDGDGSIYEEKNGIAGFEIVSHNKEILKQIIAYFEENDIPKVNIKTDKRCNINYSIKYRKQAIKKIYKILYYSNNCLYMKRKFDKFQKIALEK